MITAHARLRRGRALLLAVAALASASLLGGCLTAEKKEYVYTLKSDGSGTGRILFRNIGSADEQEAGTDNSTADYTQLINDYLKGTKFEDQHPSYTNVRKRLYEHGGQLHGEITFDFESYEQIGLYRHNGSGPWMYYAGSLEGISVEQIDTTNGSFAGARMPVVFWPEKTTEFRIVTSLETSSRPARSLLPLYKRIGSN